MGACAAHAQHCLTPNIAWSQILLATFHLCAILPCVRVASLFDFLKDLRVCLSLCLSFSLMIDCTLYMSFLFNLFWPSLVFHDHNLVALSIERGRLCCQLLWLTLWRNSSWLGIMIIISLSSACGYSGDLGIRLVMFYSTNSEHRLYILLFYFNFTW